MQGVKFLIFFLFFLAYSFFPYFQQFSLIFASFQLFIFLQWDIQITLKKFPASLPLALFHTHTHYFIHMLGDNVKIQKICNLHQKITNTWIKFLFFSFSVQNSNFFLFSGIVNSYISIFWPFPFLDALYLAKRSQIYESLVKALQIFCCFFFEKNTRKHVAILMYS